MVLTMEAPNILASTIDSVYRGVNQIESVAHAMAASRLDGGRS